MTAVVVGAATTGLKMYETYKTAKSSAEALEAEGTLKAEQRAEKTRKLAASQKVSFLSSGISLTGEGTPQDFFSETFETGKEDVQLIRSNYGRSIASTWSQARTSMLSDLTSFALSAGSGMSGGAGSMMSIGKNVGTTMSSSQMANQVDTSGFGGGY